MIKQERKIIIIITIIIMIKYARDAGKEGSLYVPRQSSNVVNSG